MKKHITYRGAVMTWECDSNHHMNVMYYINKFEHAGRNFDLVLDIFKESDKDKIGIVVLEQNIKYIREVFEDNLLYVESQLVDVGNKTLTVFHEMKNARTEELVASMHIVLVLFDKTNRKSMPLPAERKKALIASLDTPE
ncbi:MAG: thioesterase family protein [Bacteroidia bacterium]|nr:thioesterase family protein [Bacteroidia bacterium]